MPDACSTLERDAYIASVMVSYTCSASQASLNIMQGLRVAPVLHNMRRHLVDKAVANRQNYAQDCQF